MDDVCHICPMNYGWRSPIHQRTEGSSVQGGDLGYTILYVSSLDLTANGVCYLRMPMTVYG